MYTTVTEIHNAIDIGTQHIASNRKRTFLPPELDVLFNRNIIRFINQRTSSKTNVKQEGMDDSIKRVMDLEELKTNTGFLTPKVYDDVTAYITLPNNIKLPYGQVSKVYYSCNDGHTPKHNIGSNGLAKLNFVDDTVGVTNTFYKDFKLTITDNNNIQTVLFDINDYYNSESLYSPDAKFMLVNMIMNMVSTPVEIYWESYDGSFLPHTFIIIDLHNNYKSIQITYNTSVSIDAQFIPVEHKSYATTSNVTSSAEIVSSDKFNGLVNNFYYNKNRHNKPLCKIEHGRLYIHHNNFYPTDFKLEYYATPIFINSFTGQMTNLTNNIEEIIDMTIEDIFAILNGTYQGAINRNSKIE